MRVCDTIFNNITNKRSEVQRSQMTCKSQLGRGGSNVRRAGIVKSGGEAGKSETTLGTRAMNLDTCCPEYQWPGLMPSLPGSRSLGGRDSNAALGLLGESSDGYQKSPGRKPTNQETDPL